MKRFFHQHRILCPAAILSLSLACLLLLFAGIQPLRFRHFTKSLFLEEMKNDTLSMHYTIADPKAYGIPEDHVALLPYSAQSAAQQAQQTAACAKTAASIHPIFWSRDSRLLLFLLQEKLSAQNAGNAFAYYAEPLSPASGAVSNLPILLAEYTFRSEQDVKNYLTLLSQIPAYLEGLSLYEQEKADAGLFMSDTAADKVIRQCYQIMDFHKLSNDTHFLNTTFSERLQALAGKELLSPQQLALYEKQNHQLLLEQLMPAYEALGDALTSLKGSGTNTGGLALLPEGSEYYALLLQDTTGCQRSIPEIKKLLLLQLQKDSAALSALLKTSPDLSMTQAEPYFAQLSSTQQLEDLQKRMAKDFPAFPPSDTQPAYTIKQLSGSLEDYCSPAFYLTPPIDDISENSIYINTKEVPDALELYTTLAHEGYPGHLYQTVYFQLYQQAEHGNPVRSLLHYGGYAEGWALYVELHAYDYAKELLVENGADEAALSLVDALRLNRSIQLCMYSLLDIAIHYDAASREAVQKYLQGFGITDASLSNDIYEYITEEPANYPKYYLGYLEFEMLKAAAQEKWGSSYSNLRFHQLILETGPCPFSVLWERL